jgi:hypothetical protein
MKKPLHYSFAFIGFACAFLISTSTYAQSGPAGVGSSTDNQVWLDAHSLGFPDGASIASWTDLSGNGSDFTQGASLRQPTYNTSGISGVSSLTFDGVNDVLASGSIAAMESANVTYFLVYDRTTTTSDMIINADYTSSFKKWRTYMNNGQNTINSAHFSPSINWVRYTDPAGASFLSTHITPTTNSIYNQGDLEQTKSATYTTPTGHNAIFVGNRNGTATSSYTFTGEIAEVIVYNDALNPLERVLVENYLGAKYDMAIPTDHYAYNATHRFGLVAIADDGTDTQTTARGAGELEISGATDLDSDEYFVIAHTDFSFTTYTDADLPVGLPAHERLERTWRVGETGGDVGTVTLTFDLSGGDYAVPETYRVLTDDDGDFTDATTTAGTYDGVAQTVTFEIDFADGEYFTLSGIPEILEIHSVVDGVWSDVDTWDCVCIPGANDLVYIDPGTEVTVDVDGFVDYFAVEFTGSLIMDTDVTLDINGDFDMAGDCDFTDGTISFTGDVAQDITIISTLAYEFDLNDVIIENTSPDDVTFYAHTYDLNGTLFPNRGNIVFDPSTRFRIASTGVAETGRIGPIIAPTTITGNVTAQRFIGPEAADWRDICSPVIGSTFDDWDPDLAMSGEGFPDGCAYGPDGCFRSVTFTDHSIFYEVINSTDEILNGRGYEVFMGDDLEVFSGTTLNSVGTVNNSTDIVNTYTTGWTIFGNPYCSTIAFSGLTRSGSIGNYFYVYDPASGAYEWYDGASGTTSIPLITEDGLMSTGQAVWIFASSIGTITLNQGNKTETAGTYIRTHTEDNALHVTLAENNSTYSCTMQLQESAEAVDGIDEVLDIRHLATGKELAPSIAVQTADAEIRKNYIKADGIDKSFELLTSIKNDGYYTISAENWGNFRRYNKILLFDRMTGETVNLKEQSYVFYANAPEEDGVDKSDRRFTLILSNNADANENNVIQTPDFDSDDAIIIKQMGNIIDVQAVKEYDTPSVITVTNVLGQKEVFVTTTSLVAGSNLVTLPTTIKGFHIITLRTGDEIVTKKVVL